MNYRLVMLWVSILLLPAALCGASTLSDLSKDMAAIAKHASPAAVQIDVSRSAGGDKLSFGSFEVARPLTKSVGSGFVIDPKGYILTSADVVAGATEVSVRFSDGSRLPGKVTGSDEVVNCALIKVEKAGLKALALGDSDSLQPGMLVVTVNSQAGMSNSVSLGVVAATDREMGSVSGSVLQISGTIGPGASGGAVLDTEGRVVGITFAMFSPTSRVAPFNMPKIFITPSGKAAGSDSERLAYSQAMLNALKEMGSEFGATNFNMSPEQAQHALRASMDMLANMTDVARTSGSSGFAIPINRMKPIIEDLKRGKPIEHAALGMRLETLGDTIRLFPSSGSPAEKAGIKAGDELVSVDGRPYDSTVALTSYITSLKPGDKVMVVVRRDGKELPVTVVAASRAEVVESYSKALPKASVPAPKKGISLDLEDAGIAEVARALAEASGVSVVVVNAESIKGRVTLHLKSVTLDSAISYVCEALGCKSTKSAAGYILKPAK